MSRKSSAKTPPGPPQTPRRLFTPMPVAALIVAVIAITTLAYWRISDTTPQAAAPAEQVSAPGAAPIPDVPANAKYGPHKQKEYPPLQFPGYGTQRPPEVVRAVYQFAAEHPEVLGYVPCLCGCERGGHKGNDDCFVKQRAANGDVIQWEDHGMECAVCIDVAHRSMQMFASGASPRDIRAAIEREFAKLYPGHTPTPMPKTE